MNARREIISFWVGLGPSVVGEREISNEGRAKKDIFLFLTYPYRVHRLFFLILINNEIVGCVLCEPDTPEGMFRESMRNMLQIFHITGKTPTHSIVETRYPYL